MDWEGGGGGDVEEEVCARFLLRENAWGPQDNDVGPVEPDLDVWSQDSQLNKKKFACSRGCGYFWANCVLIITYPFS